jgi:hypothetical protein
MRRELSGSYLAYERVELMVGVSGKMQILESLV